MLSDPSSPGPAAAGDVAAPVANALRSLQSGGGREAIRILESLVARQPLLSGLRLNLAAALLHDQQVDEAAHHYRQAFELDPGNGAAVLGLVLCANASARSDQALALCVRHRSVQQPWPQLALAEAAALHAQGRVAEQIDRLCRALIASPGHPELYSALLLALQYSPMPPAERERAHRQWCQLRPPISPLPPAAPLPAGRRLRTVGLLSGDLRSHSVGWFAQALFASPAAGPQALRLVVLATHPPQPQDPLQCWFREQAAGWIDAAGLDDLTLAETIRREAIDILIDLSGHTSGARLSLLDHQPAPVILSAIGYPGHPGHPAIQGHLVDALTDPPASLGGSALPRLHLDPCFLCYTPPPEAPPPLLPPVDAPLCFGCFNQPAKISDPTLAVWAEILAALPEAQLLLKGRSLADPAARALLLERAEAFGIAAERLRLEPWQVERQQHLALYQQVHVALDPFPYNGTTTTCEALWMGVPVVALAGDHHGGRVGLSLLTAAGWPELVAPSPQALVATAVGWAQDRPRLERFRQQARDQLQNSVLLDAAGYRRRFEAAMHQLWQGQPGAEATRPATRSPSQRGFGRPRRGSR